MQETYYLNGNSLPTIPIPHDCIIEDIKIENQYIIFRFEQDISYHDSIIHIKPDAKSLMIKFHLADECFDLYKWHKPVKFFADKGYFKGVDSSELFRLSSAKCKLEYLSHYIAYRQIIIEMCSYDIVRLELTVDRVDFYWI